jgi:hypothetical protein
MGRIKKQKDTKEQTFKRLFGVNSETFEKMKSIIQNEYDELHKQGGSLPKLSIQEKLTITLTYYREYRTRESGGDPQSMIREKCLKTSEGSLLSYNELAPFDWYPDVFIILCGSPPGIHRSRLPGA